jgi:hypothetical protein
MGAYIFERNTS